MRHSSTTDKTEKPHGRDEVTRAIVAAAVPLIAEHGVRDVTFRDIARAAQLQHSLITRYFGTKTALVKHIAEYLGDVLFHSASGLGTGFADAWDLILSQRRTQLRALVRIMLDTESDSRLSPDAVDHMEETVNWFRDKLDIPDGRLDASLVIYVTVSFLMGTEVFGNHIQSIMSLTDQEFEDLRPRAVRTLLDSLTTSRLAVI